MASGGAAEEKKEEKHYKKYDFYSPKKFTKDKLKMLSEYMKIMQGSVLQG